MRAGCFVAVTGIAAMALGGCGRSSGDVELAARRLFANDTACPLERVTATVHAPPSRAKSREPEGPPLPELKFMADVDFMAAAGCGRTAIYACLARPAEVPYCVAPGPAPPAVSAGAAPAAPP